MKGDGHSDTTLLNAGGALLYMGELIINDGDARDLDIWDFDPITEALVDLGGRLSTDESVNALLIPMARLIRLASNPDYLDQKKLLLDAYEQILAGEDEQDENDDDVDEDESEAEDADADADSGRSEDERPEAR